MDSSVDVRIALVTTYSGESYPTAVYPDGLIIAHGIKAGLLKYFNSHILCTPCVGFQAVNKPRNSRIIHFLVSLTSLDGVYKVNSFDAYDYILCAGPHHLGDFEAWKDKNKKLYGKILIPAGYPKLDLAIGWSESSSHGIKRSPLTIVYAPTHVYEVNEELASLRAHGKMIVSTLLDEGYHLIFRPHPVSFGDADKELVSEIVSTYSRNDRFELDNSKEYQNSYSRADVMVTDLSGTGFTFALSFCRPAVFFAPNEAAEIDLNGIQFSEREAIGGVARSTSQICCLIKLFESSNIEESIKEYRCRRVFNVGHSADYIVECLFDILKGTERMEWLRL